MFIRTDRINSLTARLRLKGSGKVVATIVRELQRLAQERPDAPAFVFLENHLLDEEVLSYSALLNSATTVALALQKRNIAPNSHVLLLYPSGLELITAIFGCMLAGVTPVPVDPPNHSLQLPRIQAILRNSAISLALSTSEEFHKLSGLISQAPKWGLAFRVLCTDMLEILPRQSRPFKAVASDTALMQYMFGATEHPKGVLISHQNLDANHRANTEAFGDHLNGPIVGWLSLNHDLGLIGGALQSIYWRQPYIFMAATTFFEHPESWLRAIDKFRASYSSAPNFAFDLCARRLSETQLAGLDLSSWKIASCGGETVRAATLRKFSERFTPYGFDASSIAPCYSMAEVTQLVAATRRQLPATELTLDRDRISDRTITPATSETTNVIRLVGCGTVASDLDLRVVDPVSHLPCALDKIGEIWVRGPSVSPGHWADGAKETNAFGKLAGVHSDEPFFRTGDLGFMQDGELFITGRCDELIIARGTKYVPEDIESAAEAACTLIRRSHSVAVGLEGRASEAIGLVCEIEQGNVSGAAWDAAATAIRASIQAVFGLQPKLICFVAPESLPKTSRGQLHRRAIRESATNGTLLHHYLWASVSME